MVLVTPSSERQCRSRSVAAGKSDRCIELVNFAFRGFVIRAS